MSISQFFYALRTGATNISRHKTASVASIATNTVCILLISALLIITKNIQINMSVFQTENTFLAFVDDRLSQTAAERLQPTIAAISGVSDVAFITKEEAFEQFISNNTQLSQTYLEPSILRDRYAIRIKSDCTASDVADLVLAIPGIAEIRFDDTVSKGFAVIERSVTLIGVFLTGLLLAVCTIIMSNTVNLTISARTDEIQVMKMMGAYDSFIGMPFICEGVITGITSAILSFIASACLYLAASELLTNAGAISLVIILPLTELIRPLFISSLLLGLITGWTGSMIAVRKYLRARGK